MPAKECVTKQQHDSKNQHLRRQQAKHSGCNGEAGAFADIACNLGELDARQLNFLAREMTFEFLRPVFSGETITTEVRITSVQEEGARQWASVEAVCTNEAGKEVLRAHVRGFVPRPT